LRSREDATSRERERLYERGRETLRENERLRERERERERETLRKSLEGATQVLIRHVPYDATVYNTHDVMRALYDAYIMI
jgi:hypothetical protein